MNVSLEGSVRLEALRERDVMRINALYVSFLTPLRWLVPNWTDFLKEGPDTLETIPATAGTPDWANIGIGSYDAAAPQSHYSFWFQNVLRCYNEWMKWPEDPDITGFTEHGPVAVPLSHAWNRCRYDVTPDDADDYEIDVSGSTMDMRALAEKQARFRSAMKRDVLTYARWMEMVKAMYGKNADPSREVDQVPIMLDQVDLGVNPREIPATDGASLGQWQSLFDFRVGHTLKPIVAAEHCIVSHFLIIRFAPIIEGCHPLGPATSDWYDLTADPEYLHAAQPQAVEIRDIQNSSSATQLGYLPRGWKWRTSNDVIGRSIDVRDSFPYMLPPTTQAEAKDATRIKQAFRSQALDDYMVDIYFREESNQPIGDAMDSYFSGMVEETSPGIGGSNDEFPHQGKIL